MGLANAGKTSILHSLTREFDILTIIKPTVSVERMHLELMGKDLFFWDFGGQSVYREKYLTNPAVYFEDIGAFYYVIDIQAPALLEDNIQYFRDVYTQLRKFSPGATVTILFHKDDPLISADPQKVKLKNAFLKEIQPILEADHVPITLYNTSIYNAPSIITAISQPLFANEKIFQNLNAIIRSFCENYKLLFGMLFSKEFFDLGSYVSPHYSAEKSHRLITQFFAQFKPDMEAGAFFEMEVENTLLMASKFQIRFGRRTLPFYVAIVLNDQSLLEEEEFKPALTKLNESLVKILMNVDLATILANIEQNIPNQ